MNCHGAEAIGAEEPLPGHSTDGRDDYRKRARTACTRCKSKKQKCDRTKPACSNCRRSGVACDVCMIQADDPPPIAYTRLLEERVAMLEIRLTQLQSMAGAELSDDGRSTLPPTASTTSSKKGPGGIVDFLTVGHLEEPAYIGSASGLSLALNLGEIIQATVWNKVLSPSNPAENTGDGVEGSTSHQGRPISIRDLLSKGAGPPSDDDGCRMINAYLNQVHFRYPFLNRSELWNLHSRRKEIAGLDPNTLSKAERFNIFKLYLVYGIGAMFLQVADKNPAQGPENYYVTALQHINSARDARTIRNLEAMTLLTIYHLRSASSHALWYLIGYATRACIDLGLHRKLRELDLDPHTIQMRRRLFWTVYCLDCVISTTLGRPPSISCRHIDLDFPAEVQISGLVNHTILSQCRIPDSSSRSPSGHKHETLKTALFFFRLRKLEAHIYDTIYYAKQPLTSILADVPPIFDSLQELHTSLSECTEGQGLFSATMHYNRAVCLLLRPFLSVLSPSSQYYQTCLLAARSICQAQQRLQQRDGGHSFIAVQTIFVAGITILYCIWTQPEEVWSVSLSNDIRACSLVLAVMSERTGWVKRYRDAFELLATATIDKVEGNSIGDGTILEGAQAAATTYSNVDLDFDFDINQLPHLAGGVSNTSERNSEDETQGSRLDSQVSRSDKSEAMALICELAKWLDQGGSSQSQVQMPDFETLENLSQATSIWDN